MLRDLDTQLVIVELLLKTYSKAENYAQQCKKMVLEFIPLIVVKSQKFLEMIDVCSAIHACKLGTQASAKTMLLTATL
ncbi:hypothetical protein GUJ93_ZPchr0004g39923 [Zizania palustris]|uniref:Saposin B type region 2 domain-containing protein n=1 Tax=Zizania palustris TaxID=103762 RepID=A0A8J5SJR5_ZIZPA|nr:hypothetical protein GUJ93_ZPchr0004g39923 [Zizania palustris]